jgi:hypothetical protein
VDGQKVLLSLMNMGGESTAAWRQFINDLDARGLKRPEFVIVDGAPGLEAALVTLWGEDLPIQRCTVHKHRNLLAHAPKHMHDELTEDYRDMIVNTRLASPAALSPNILRDVHNDVVNCSIPDDHIDPRRSAFFMARSVLRNIRERVHADPSS